jgi:DNA-binding NarL/FixJ family response regulator
VADSTGSVRVVIADDHAVLRRGLRALLDAEPDIAIVAEAGDAEGALQCAVARRPRVVVLDLNMPGTPTLAAIPRLRAAAPEAAVVVLTVDNEPGIARLALTAGASGYVVKDAAEEELVAAVRAVAAGRTYVNPALGARLATLTGGGEPEVGSTFANHRIDAVAGRGGMGVVYSATDLTLDRRVALKVIAPAIASDAVFRARFERECRAAASIDHPNVVPVFHAGEEAGLLYLTMRFIDGTNLRSVLREEGALEPDRAVGLIAQVAAALDAAHDVGLVHRDVKPANVLLVRDPDGERAFLTDFGVTMQRSNEELTRTGLAVGTVDYMAPEQAAGRDADARSDVYSLGCVLFETLTGHVVFERESDLDRLWAHTHDPPPSPLEVRPGLPDGLADVVARALLKNPAERQQSAGQLAREARAALDG